MSNTAEATKTSPHRSHPVLEEVVLHGVGQIASAFVVRRVRRGAEAIGQG